MKQILFALLVLCTYTLGVYSSTIASLSNAASPSYINLYLETSSGNEVYLQTLSPGASINITDPGAGNSIQARDTFGRVFYNLNGGFSTNVTIPIYDPSVSIYAGGYGLVFNYGSVDLFNNYYGKSQNFTIEILFKTNMTTVNGNGGSIYRHRTSGFSLYIVNGIVTGQVNTGSITPVRTNNAYNDGQWHYAALTSNGTVLTLYVDGEVVSAPCNPVYYGDGQAAIGRDGNSVGSGEAFFFGQLADFRLWTESKTVNDLMQLQNLRSLGLSAWINPQLAIVLPLPTIVPSHNVTDISMFLQPGFFYAATECTANVTTCSPFATCTYVTYYLSYCQCPINSYGNGSFCTDTSNTTTSLAATSTASTAISSSSSTTAGSSSSVTSSSSTTAGSTTAATSSSSASVASSSSAVSTSTLASTTQPATSTSAASSTAASSTSASSAASSSTAASTTSQSQQGTSSSSSTAAASSTASSSSSSTAAASTSTHATSSLRTSDASVLSMSACFVIVSSIVLALM